MSNSTAAADLFNSIAYNTTPQLPKTPLRGKFQKNLELSSTYAYPWAAYGLSCIYVIVFTSHINIFNKLDCHTMKDFKKFRI